MFKNFSLTNLTITPKSTLPEYIRIGRLNVLSDVTIPVLFPINSKNFSGITLLYSNNENKREVLNQMQYIAIDLLKQLNPDMLRLSFVDIGFDTSFPYLCALEIPQVKFIDKREDLYLEIEDLYAHARYISTKCLQFTYPDLATYNQEAQYKEAYRFLFIPEKLSGLFKESYLEKVTMLIRDGWKYGIYVFTVEKTTEKQEETNNLIKVNYPSNCIDYTPEQVVDFKQDIERLSRLFQHMSLTPENYNTLEIESLVNHLKNIGTKEVLDTNFLEIPIGLSGREEASLTMGKRSGIYHGFIAGQSGTGKSNLLNNIITSIASRYSPDELRLYLLDYKQGVEFKIFENHPNVEMLMLDNTNLQAGIDALKHLVDEIQIRAQQFSKVGISINNIDEYNRQSAEKMPHILMIVDEVQQLFKSYDIRRQVNPLVQDIAKQGRAFGIHMLFSSQSYTDCHIEADILSQMPLRIAFRLASSAECRAIMGPDNTAPMQLPNYTAIYNEKNGNKEANMQVRMNELKIESIPQILQEASKRPYTPFQKIIRTNADRLAQQVEPTQKVETTETVNPLNTKQREGYKGVDFESEFGF